MTLVEICIIIITAFLVITAIALTFAALYIVGFFRKLKKLVHKPLKAVSDITDSARSVVTKIKEEGENLAEAVAGVKDSVQHLATTLKRDFSSSASGIINLVKTIFTFIRNLRSR